MTLRDYINKWVSRFPSDGISTPRMMLGEFIIRGMSKIDRVEQIGTNVLDKEWDILLVFDACRLDMYRELVNSESDSIISVGGHSEEWMERTFSRRDLSDVAYVSANVYSHQYQDKNFHTLEEPWRYAWDDDLGTVTPDDLTDAALRVWKDKSPRRMIVHYMQPHYPFISDGKGKYKLSRRAMQGEDVEINNYIWETMKDGEMSFEEIREEYWANLDLVSKEIETYRNKVTGTIVVTADHGNSAGEFGIWGHRKRTLAPYTRRVPWDVYRFSGDDTNTYSSVERPEERGIEDKLEALGYK